MFLQFSIKDLGECLNQQLEELYAKNDQENAVTVEEVKDLCKQKIDEILQISQTQLKRMVEILHAKENEKRNHMRLHYDQKLNICRVSHRLEREHNSCKSRVHELHVGEKMHEYYKAKIRQINAELEQCQARRQVQDQTLNESQQVLVRTEHILRGTVDEFNAYRTVMEEKCATLEEKLTWKRKQEVWAHFRIVHLKKKVKTAERALHFKKTECKKKIGEMKELENRLKTSMEIRGGLERAFELRACIRSRSGIRGVLQEDDKIQISRPPTRQMPRTPTRQMTKHCTCLDKGVQTSLHRPETKHQGVDTSPFYTDQLNQLNRLKEEAEQHLHLSNKKEEQSTRQNEAYRRLMSGKSFAMILAAKHRELCEKPTSMDAEILYDLTMPQGILSEDFSQKNEHVDKKPRPSTARRRGTLIPKSTGLASFGGITGNQIEMPTGQGL